ncbi:hypothetical protein BD626DRAFT_480593 [Schizophyllum amplum]|uniref:Uncharacterized protein n=1 Tax=Schizophyllum amplum TaxID=97359 RepID=A0A550CTB1_9AGAR|nr:hypothetical protein BD626DRAFT_480593 [Auriculariopsis ampla]
MIPQLDGELAGGRLIKRVPSRFSEAEVTEYLAFIDYPNAANISPATFDASLENLALVVHKQLLHLPFSNLDVH